MATPKAKFEISARDRSKATLNRFKGRIERVKNSVFSLRGGVTALAGAAGLGLLVKKSLETNDALAKTADKLGITTQSLAGLQHAANLTGVAQTTLTKALTKQQKAIFNADRGVLTYKQHFDALGLSTEALKQQSPDEQFKTIAEALKNVESQTQKTAIAYDIFGGRGTALINTLALGRDGLEAAAAEADALGLAVSRVDAAKIEQANDSFTRLKGVAAGVGNAIAANVAPYITALATQFVNAAKEAGGMSNFIGRALDNVVGAVGFVKDSFRGLQVVWALLKVGWAATVNGILSGIASLDKSLADIISKIPGVDYAPSSNLQDWARESALSLEVAKFELADLVHAPMPSENVKKWAEEVQYKAQVAAEAIAKTKAQMTGSGGSDTSTGPAANPAAEKQAAAMSKSIDAIQQSLLTEEQRMQESYTRRRVMVSNAFAQDLISQQTRDELMAGLAAEHEAKKTAIAQQGEADRRAVFTAGLGAAANIFTNLGALMGKEGAKMNAKQKLLARAGIIASTAQAVMNALAVPPYPLGLALAAGAALKGADQLRKVGGGGSVGAPVSSIATQQQQSQPIPQQALPGNGQGVQVINLHFNGPASDETIKGLVSGVLKEDLDLENVVLTVNNEGRVVAA